MQNLLAQCPRHLKSRRTVLAAPLLALLLFAFYAWRAAGADPAQPVAHTMAAEQGTQWAQARATLQVLSGIALERQPDAAACNAFLARQLERFPQYINLAFSDERGEVWCRAKALPQSLALPAVLLTQQQPLRFAVTDDSWAIALPRIAADGRRLGAVIALLPTQQPISTATASTPQQRGSMRWYLLLLSCALALGWLTWRYGLHRAIDQRIRRLRSGFHRRTAKSLGDTQEIRSAYALLKDEVAQKEIRVQQLVQLDELSQRLQCCASVTELADTVARCAQAIFPGSQGALYLRAEAERFGLALAWGGSTPAQSLQTLDCHALHSDQATAGHGTHSAVCAHAKTAADYVCIPLQAASGPLGLLHLARLRRPGSKRAPPWAATAIAERSAIALGTLRRQEQLQSRAIRDALTGLFNRGFMEEALVIEQRRALRRGSSIGVMLLDVDHFKRYNDRFGHAAGDAVLRGIGALVHRTVREGDMPCRYGGEEFVIILPGADLDATLQRAETLRAAVAAWRPEIAEGAAGEKVTASIGVACFPQHGMTWQAVLKRADAALYAAKHAGRNRVLTADAYKSEQAVPA